MAARKKKFRFKRKIKRAFYLVLIGLAVFFVVRQILYDSRPRAYGIKMPKGYAIHGIDVSRWQGEINWSELEKVRSGKDSIPISFAFIKATEGRSLLDPQFEDNWNGIAKTRIIRGAYHYFVPSRNAKEQADNFIKNVKLSKGDLPPVLDVEALGRKGSADLRNNIKIWLKAVEKHYGMKPIIYTYIDFYEKYLKDGELEYPLWIAHYYEKKMNVNKNWLFWQHSDSGQIPGLREKVDFNVFSGSLEDLKGLCK